MALPTGVAARCWQVYSRVCLAMLKGLNDHLFATDEPLALLHGDLSSHNILWHADTPTLIDWEDTRVGDPAEDIAYFFTETHCDAHRRQAFWQGYRAQYRGNLHVLQARVRVWEPVTACSSAFWWLDRYLRRRRVEAGGPDDGSAPRAAAFYLANALDRLDGAVAALAPGARPVGRSSRTTGPLPPR